MATASLGDMLEAFNAKALEMDPPLKERKSFRRRKDAHESLSKVGLKPEDVPASNGNGTEATKTPKAKKTRTKKASKPKKESKHVVSAEDDPVLAAFSTQKDSKQYQVLKALIDGERMSVGDLIKITGTNLGSIKAILQGIVKKTEGKLLRGKNERPKYKLVKEKEDKVLYYSLQKED